jgi:uncharacterized protein YecT (DUF1311 family)
MTAKLISILAALFVFSCTYSQGNIDHIKNQEYLKHKGKVDCNNLKGDNLSEKICANLAFQKSDSLLTLIYDSLLDKANGHPIDSLKFKIEKMQVSWRKFRDEHCAIIWDGYNDCGSCNIRAVAYLTCLKELTDGRIIELKRLYAMVVEE